MVLKLVTFDVNKTLIQLMKKAPEYYAIFAKRFGVTVDISKLATDYEKAVSDAQSLFPCYGLNQGLSVCEWWSVVGTNCFKNSIKDKTLMEIVNNYIFHELSKSCYWQTLPNAKPVLEKIIKNNIRLGIVSNFDYRLEPILKELGLFEQFDFIFTASKIGLCKPDPKVFEYVMRTQQIGPSELIHIGDSFVDDYCTPRRLGIRSFLFCNKIGDVALPDSIFNLKEIEAKLELK